MRLDPHYARLLRGAKADREDGAEHDRHLAKDVSLVALADDALDAVGGVDGLDTAFEHCEERALVAAVGRELAWNQVDICRRTRKPLAIGLVEGREDRYRCDFLRGHHRAAPEPVFVAGERMVIGASVTVEIDR